MVLRRQAVGEQGASDQRRAFDKGRAPPRGGALPLCLWTQAIAIVLEYVHGVFLPLSFNGYQIIARF